jgi:hypothetical protein
VYVYIGKWEEIVFGDMEMEMVYFKTTSQNCMLIETIKSTAENYSEDAASVSTIKFFETSRIRPSAANGSVIIFISSVEVQFYLEGLAQSLE